MPEPLRRLLVCEGPEDCHFFHRLIEERQLPRFHIWSGASIPGKSGGNTTFADAIKAFEVSRTREYQQLRDILIVADNNDAPAERFANVCAHIERLFGPGTGPSAPLLRTQTHPAVTVLMIPWTDEDGHLERLCVEAARSADQKAGSNVDAFLSLMGADRWPSQSRQGKAWLHANLAVRCASDPGMPLGKLFGGNQHTLIPVRHRSFDRIANVLSGFGP